MSAYYLDASAWVKRYFLEPGSPWMRRFWLSDTTVYCSDLGFVKVVATIVRRHRGGGLQPSYTERLLNQADHDADELNRVHVSDAVVTEARLLASRRGLRGADCIHLATAIHVRGLIAEPVTIIASDNELLDAAGQEGFAVLDPAASPPMPAN